MSELEELMLKSAIDELHEIKQKIAETVSGPSGTITKGDYIAELNYTAKRVDKVEGWLNAIYKRTQ